MHQNYLWLLLRSAYELQPWEEIEQGRHEFPFALKVWISKPI